MPVGQRMLELSQSLFEADPTATLRAALSEMKWRDRETTDPKSAEKRRLMRRAAAVKNDPRAAAYGNEGAKSRLVARARKKDEASEATTNLLAALDEMRGPSAGLRRGQALQAKSVEGRRFSRNIRAGVGRMARKFKGMRGVTRTALTSLAQAGAINPG